MTIAQDSINVLLEVNAVYQRIASVNPLTQQTSRFYDRITQIVQTRSQQAFSPDLGLPYQEWSQSAGGYVLPVDTVDATANMVCTHLDRVLCTGSQLTCYRKDGIRKHLARRFAGTGRLVR